MYINIFLHLIALYVTDNFDKDVDDAESEGLCSIVIALMQEHRRSKRNVKVKSLQIAFFLYPVSSTL